MKKLVKSDSIEKAFKEGRMTIEVEIPDTIITPEAESTAQKLGVKIIKKEASNKLSYSDRNKIIAEVMGRFPGGKYSRTMIEKAIEEVLNVR